MSKYLIKHIPQYKCKWWVYCPDSAFNLPSERDAKMAVKELNKLQARVEELEAENKGLKDFIQACGKLQRNEQTKYILRLSNNSIPATKYDE